ncbi:substrate-binding domain-containing protein [Synechococcus sp. CS-1331]|uniref:substrate-binding domain-containing protein n=1 Tax=Synechococcus sp. CS-1331 TaxID=2847973 RepID=UPI00223BA509|nr:substrate-binding domain-containing protein [Synechococcus sp. CS-1331]MCT0227935.1 substrate-binding domain-containing protein [Synechococcus sp. CS-1331]
MPRACAALALAALLAGCTGGSTDSSTDAPAPPPLRGATSTFAASAFLLWFNQLAVEPGIVAELEVVGSGASIRSFLAGQIDFAVTDSPPSLEEIGAAPQGLVAFPVTAGAIAVAYNLPGCDLRLKREQLVAIYLAEVTNFAELGCADQPITVLHRADSSGSTANFTASLAAFNPAWRQGPGSGRELRWPVGRAVLGSDGMATALKETPGSIGYVESAYVRAPLQAAALQNGKGQLVRPNALASSQALAAIPLDDRLLGGNPDPPVGYPIVSFSWMLVPSRSLGARLEPLKTSLGYILSQAGQDDAERLGYVPLPTELRERALRQFALLSPGSALVTGFQRRVLD